jgi:hypothetical protein
MDHPSQNGSFWGPNKASNGDVLRSSFEETTGAQVTAKQKDMVAFAVHSYIPYHVFIHIYIFIYWFIYLHYIEYIINQLNIIIYTYIINNIYILYTYMYI